MRQDTSNRKFCVRLAVRADPQHTREPTPTCIWSYGSSSSDCSSSCEGIFSRANTCEQVNGMGSNCLSVQSFVSPSPQQNTLMVAHNHRSTQLTRSSAREIYRIASGHIGHYLVLYERHAHEVGVGREGRTLAALHTAVVEVVVFPAILLAPASTTGCWPRRWKWSVGGGGGTCPARPHTRPVTREDPQPPTSHNTSVPCLRVLRSFTHLGGLFAVSTSRRRLARGLTCG